MRVSPEQQAAPETLRLEFSRFFQIIDTDRDEIITEQEYIAGLDLAKEVLRSAPMRESKAINTSSGFEPRSTLPRI